MTQGCDYAFSHPNPAGLAAAGLEFAMRYVGPGTDDKHLHVDERDQIWAAGLSICLLGEGTANGALGGFPVGVAHAQSSLAGARTVGAPDTVPIYFAVDFDVTEAQWPTCAAYLNGAATVLGAGRVGVYGGIRAMQWALRDRVARWFFQTYAWSYGRWFTGNHVEQYQNDVNLAGGVVDLCRARQNNFGQWGPGAEDDMTDEQWALIRDAIGRGQAIFDDLDTIEWTDAPSAGRPNQNKARLDRIDAELAALKAMVAGLTGAGGLVAHTHPVGETGPAQPTE